MWNRKSTDVSEDIKLSLFSFPETFPDLTLIKIPVPPLAHPSSRDFFISPVVLVTSQPVGVLTDLFCWYSPPPDPREWKRGDCVDLYLLYSSVCFYAPKRLPGTWYVLSRFC